MHLSSSAIMAAADHDGENWLHASIAGEDHMPSDDDLVLLHRAVFAGGRAHQVFALAAEHVNIHQRLPVRSG